MTNLPRDQHTIPECYLKEFTFDSSNKKVYYFDKGWVHGKAVQPVSISRLYNRDIFTRSEGIVKDTSMETDVLKKIDDKYSKCLSEIKSAVLDFRVPKDKELTDLLVFLFFLPVRTTNFKKRSEGLKDHIQENKEYFIKLAGEKFMETFEKDIHLVTIQDKLNFQAEAYIDMLNHSKSTNYSIDLIIPQANLWKEEILKRGLYFIRLDGDGSFITSDNPFYIQGNVTSKEFKENPIPIVLTPKIALVLGPQQKNFLPIYFKAITKNDLAYEDINNSVIINSYLRTYSQNKEIHKEYLHRNSLL